jgi:molecular chaperone DnaK
MKRTTIDFGIDLGTTNSSIAVIKGIEAEAIKNNENNEITPSAVGIDKNNRLQVGQRAKNQVGFDEDNAKAEFKLQMGTKTLYHFTRSGRRLTPEELSAEVLKELKAAVLQRTGEDLQAAVVTVPAAFELPQCEATKQAAELAGIKTCALLQEPVAAALAYGFQSENSKAFWLVYDLGGGTFDAAVMQLRDGLIQVVNHGGDNDLGGKLIDWKIVEELLIPAVADEFSISDLRRGNPRWKTAIAKLKQVAEEAKIQLSRNESFWVDIEFSSKHGFSEPVQFEYELRQEDVQRLAEPIILRSLNICKRVLVEKRLSIDAIGKVILVGGPTLAPYLREQMGDWIGDGSKLDFSNDPLTVVSRGAAIFAGTQRIKGVSNKSVAAGKFALELEYQPVGPETEPLVGGKVVAPAGQSLARFTIEFVNPDAQPQWRSGKIPLNGDGVFMTNLWAEKGKANTFLIELCDARGTRLETVPDRITYRIGTTITEQPLINSVGIALADNKVLTFFEKGTPLPARKRHTFHTTNNLRAGQTVGLTQKGGLILVPIIEGEASRADRNRSIGFLEIKPNQVRRDVPAGSEIEVIISIDESRLVRAKGYVPLLDEEFEASMSLEKRILEPQALHREVEREKTRLEELREKAEELEDAKARMLLQQLEDEQIELEMESSLNAAGLDKDAAGTCQNRLHNLKVKVDAIEDTLLWPSLLAKAEDGIDRTQKVVSQYGSNEERKEAASLEQDSRRAIDSRDADLLRRKVDELSDLYYRVYTRQPEFWIGFLRYLEEEKANMTNPGMAEQLFGRAYRAINENDLEVLKSSIRQLCQLLPQEQQEEANKAFGSTVTAIRQ